MRIILISCASRKLREKAEAKDIYISDLFKLNYKYALSLNPDKIFILSAKHHLLHPQEEISPYNHTLNNMKKQEIHEWSMKILSQLRQNSDLKKDEFIFLAGENYRKFLLPYIKNYKIPLAGLGIGKQLKFLKNKTQISEKCQKIHEIFNNLKIHKFPFQESEIPENGIYILFEKNEKAHNTNRIVRIGTHTGQNNLKKRLREHFIDENKIYIPFSGISDS
jgi:hypothetical protein